MKLAHLQSMLFQKNKKGRLREIRIIPKKEDFAYASGGSRSVYPASVSRCHHCGTPVATTRRISVVRATCSRCVERERLARVHGG